MSRVESAGGVDPDTLRFKPLWKPLFFFSGLKKIIIFYSLVLFGSLSPSLPLSLSLSLFVFQSPK